MSGEARNGDEPEKAIAFAAMVFERIETASYVILGLLLAVATALALCSGAASLWKATMSFGAADLVVATIDRLLFVFMLVEIFHTVRVSFRTRVLRGEPFLVVALIATIRRILVITLKSSAGAHDHAATAPSHAEFVSTMTELGVLAGLILVMVSSIVLLRRSEQKRSA